MPRDEQFLGTLRIEPASEGFRAEGFDCGELDLTNYISDGTSAQDESAGVSRSYLAHGDGAGLVGYFTVLADRIHLETKERPKELRYPNAPALKLGRMGVELSHQGKGVGEWILDNVVGLAQLLSERIGVRYVTLDALPNSKLVPWYERYGFVRNKSEKKRERLFRRLKPGDDLPHISMRYDIRI